jgi:hypothetical protein
VDRDSWYCYNGRFLISKVLYAPLYGALSITLENQDLSGIWCHAQLSGNQREHPQPFLYALAQDNLEGITLDGIVIEGEEIEQKDW